jgi:hypothetical protein
MKVARRLKRSSRYPKEYICDPFQIASFRSDGKSIDFKFYYSNQCFFLDMKRSEAINLYGQLAKFLNETEEVFMKNNSDVTLDE